MAHTHKKTGGFTGSPASQRGAVIILLTVAMVAILACAGLALDVSHTLINKTRLQNTVDAAALAGAKILDQTADTALAAAAVQAMFDDNADDPGNFELNNANLTPTVQFSNTVAPFVPGTLPAMYVRVIQNGFVLPAWLIQVIGINQKTVGATAVAGPSPTINYSCNLVPLIICGDPLEDPSVPGNSYWGYVDGDIHRLKSGSNSGEPDIGPGTFNLAELGGSGANVVRENLAGGYNGCAYAGDTIPTQPGNEVGPVVQGLNTRFDVYTGPISPGDYPPDVIIEEQAPPQGLEYGSRDPTHKDYDLACPSAITLNGVCVSTASELDFSLADYDARIAANSLDIPLAAGGAFDRRKMPVFVADCTNATGGKQDLPILSFGCFFLLQKSVQKGQENEIFGEFAEDCSTPGFAGPEPTIIPGPHVIQLYKDSDGNDA
jgi:hypothetical protein